MSLKKSYKKTESKTINEERKKEILKRTYNSNFLFFICYTRQNGSKNVSIIWNKLVSTKLDKLIYLLKWEHRHYLNLNKKQMNHKTVTNTFSFDIERIFSFEEMPILSIKYYKSKWFTIKSKNCSTTYPCDSC